MALARARPCCLARWVRARVARRAPMPTGGLRQLQLEGTRSWAALGHGGQHVHRLLRQRTRSVVLVGVAARPFGIKRSWSCTGDSAQSTCGQSTSRLPSKQLPVVVYTHPRPRVSATSRTSLPTSHEQTPNGRDLCRRLTARKPRSVHREKRSEARLPDRVGGTAAP